MIDLQIIKTKLEELNKNESTEVEAKKYQDILNDLTRILTSEGIKIDITLLFVLQLGNKNDNFINDILFKDIVQLFGQSELIILNKKLYQIDRDFYNLKL